MGMLFALILLFATGDAVVLDGPFTAADCAIAMMDSPAPPDGTRLLCVAARPVQVAA